MQAMIIGDCDGVVRENHHTEEIAEIVTRAMAGEEAAFGVLYTRFFTPLYRYFLARGCSTDCAHDLSHDVFVKALRARERFDGTRYTFQSFLFTIAARTLIDYRRKKRAIAMAPDVLRRVAHALQRRTGEDDSVLVAMDKAEAVKAVMRAVQSLRPRDRDVLLLRWINELSYEEIADILNCSVSTVRQIHHRALRRARNNISYKRQ